MSDLIKWLRTADNHDLPNLGVKAADRIDALEREAAELTAERDFLQEIIDGRPAINQALPQSYIRWSQSIYSSDVVLAHFRGAKERKE